MKNLVFKSAKNIFIFICFFTLKIVAQTTVPSADTIKLISIINNGTVVAAQGKFDSVIYYNLQAIEFAKTIKKNEDIWLRIQFSKAYKNVGKSYLNIGQPEMALPYLILQRPFISNNDMLSDYFKNRAEVDRMFTQAGQGVLDTLHIYYDSLTQLLSNKVSRAGYNLVALDLGLTDFYLAKNELNNAEKYINHANELAPLYADEALKDQAVYMKGLTYFSVGKYNEALNSLLVTEPKASGWDQGLYVELLRSIAKCYGKLGDYKNAYLYYDKFAPLRDSLYVKAAQQSFAEMEAKYQNKDKQTSIDDLSAEQQLANLKLKTAKRDKIYYIAGLILLGTIIASMFAMYKAKQKNTKLLQQKNEAMNVLNENLEKANITKAKLFSIISHDLRNPISQVYQFLDLQRNSPQVFTEAEKEQYNQQISDAAGVVLETMEDLLIWSKSQMQQFTTTIVPIVLNNIVKDVITFLHTQAIKKDIIINGNIKSTLIVNSDKNILEIIIRNLLQNAITYSPSNHPINIDAFQNTNATIISITDFGAGMPERIRRLFNEPQMTIDSNSSGLGLTIVKEMATLINAQITINTNKPNGTIISIKLPF